MDNWPLVDQNDDGIRPAGKPDECFYCNQKIGQEHAADCVIVKKRVKVRYSYEIELDIPYFWTPYQFERHRNDSGWCASNGLDDIDNYQKELGHCLCGKFKAELITIIDDTPRRNLKTDPATHAQDVP